MRVGFGGKSAGGIGQHVVVGVKVNVRKKSDEMNPYAVEVAGCPLPPLKTNKTRPPPYSDFLTGVSTNKSARRSLWRCSSFPTRGANTRRSSSTPADLASRRRLARAVSPPSSNHRTVPGTVLRTLRRKRKRRGGAGRTVCEGGSL